MLKVLKTLLTIRTSSAINLFLYYVQKLPLLGKAVNNTVYANLDMKRTVSLLVIVLFVLGGFVSKLLYLYLLVYWPVTGLHITLPAQDQLKLFAHIFLMLSFLAAGVSSANVLEPKREKYVAVKLMRMSPERYMHVMLSCRYALYFIGYLPALLLFVLLLGGSAIQAVWLAVAVTLWRVFCEYMHLKLFEKTGIVLVKKVAVVWLVILAGYIAAYFPLFAEQAPSAGPILLHWLPPLAIAALGIWAAFQLANYRYYREAVDAATKRDDPYLNLGSMVADAQKTSVQTQDNDYAEQTLRQERYESKQGYAYLNAIFFARHRSLIRHPVHKRLMIAAAAGILGSVALWIINRMAVPFQLEAASFFPYLPVAMSVISVGERTCKAMFYHCDISLMRYSFYRLAAFGHFMIRLRKIISQNLLIAVVVGVALTMPIIVQGGNVLTADVALLWGSVVSLSVFFSIHHLFLYYIFQPYSTDLNLKNPFYFLISLVVSFACGLAIWMRVPPVTFTAIVVLLTTVYLLTALLLVRRYAHQTFRVK